MQHVKKEKPPDNRGFFESQRVTSSRLVLLFPEGTVLADMSQGTSCPEIGTGSKVRVGLSESTPDDIWSRLAPLLAARRSMRLYDVTQQGFVSARPLTTKLPTVPAAVPLFSRGRAAVIALDFDAKQHGHGAVVEDVARVLTWLGECGGRAVVDVSSSGGRHVLIPMPPGRTIAVDALRPLLNQLAVRLPTLDITPMTNPATGCITVPGSRCREGGHRRLVEDLATAVDILTVGSDPETLTRLAALLGGIPTPHAPTSGVEAEIRASHVTDRIIGAGDRVRLHPSFCRVASAPPDSVTLFAATGQLDTTRWPSRSEARQSVITHEILIGATPTDIIARSHTSEWAGLRAAYVRYANPDQAIRRDTLQALNWVASSIPEPIRDTRHKIKHTGGTHSPALRKWLTVASHWVTHEYRGRKDRWTTHAVIQALAWSAAVSGHEVEGVPVVGVGGRSLSIAAGLLPESTVWSILGRLRESPGSPLLLIERGMGQNPDRYALVAARIAGSNGEIGPSTEELQIESVHPAWSVIGWRHKAVYDVISSSTEPLTIEDALAAASIGRTSGYETVLDLRVAGLIAMENNQIVLGSVDLDTIAHLHGLATAVRERVVRHRAERIIWREWLAAREDARTPPDLPLVLYAVVEDAAHPPDEAYYAAVMDAGPSN